MTGRSVSEEVVPAPHLALFRLKDVMTAALVSILRLLGLSIIFKTIYVLLTGLYLALQIRDEPLVRALFTIVSAPCPQNHRQCLSRVHTRAQYWLARASFEESCGRQHEVAKLFEEALRVGAEVSFGVRMDYEAIVNALHRVLEQCAEFCFTYNLSLWKKSKLVLICGWRGEADWDLVCM